MCDDSPDYGVTIPAKTGSVDAYLQRPARRAAVTGSIPSGSVHTTDGPKEAGPAGGESGARAHGPALGGEAGSVLIRKLIRMDRGMPPPASFRHRWRIATGTLMQRQLNQNYNICRRV
jgi:hypothetical protein